MNTVRTSPSRRALAAAASGIVVAVLVVGCGADDGTSASTTAGSAPSPTASATAAGAASVSITDPWVKAADSGMTAAFGTLVNDGDSDVTVLSASSDVASVLELHETVESDDGSMAMQPKDGGFAIPAGGEHVLAPGGDHLMIMDLQRPLEPGEDVTITLALDDGSTYDVVATVKDFAGADESYQNGDTGGLP